MIRESLGRTSPPSRHAIGEHRATGWTRCAHCPDDGFTLVELLIVMVVVPIIIGGLAVGLLSVFSLQNSVASRLSNTEDSAVVAANYRNDIESAAVITTESTSSPQCGSGDQLLGLQWDLNSTTGNYETGVSYIETVNGSTFSLVRQYCTLGNFSTPVSTATISYNIDQAAQAMPTLYDIKGDQITTAQSGWISTQSIAQVEFQVAEPQVGSNQTTLANPYLYTLAASPATSSSVVDTGAPLSPSTTTSCGFAAAGSGALASSLCFIDFSPLTGNNLLAAEEGCLEMSVDLPGSYIMYFCLGIAGAPIWVTSLPTYKYAYLGNSGTYTDPNTGQQSSTDVNPNYYNIPGAPALYQSCEGVSVSKTLIPGTNVYACGGGGGSGVTTLTLTGIKVVTPLNVPATNWELVSADAETTDQGESIVWTAGAPATSINIISNSINPVGDACNYDNQTWNNAGGFFQVNPSNSKVAECSGGNQTVGGGKTGAEMVYAVTPGSFTIQMTGTGLEAVAIGLLVS